MAKYTPGPWRAAHSADGGSDILAGGEWIGVSMIHDGIERTQADANLVAASPELLAELEHAEWTNDEGLSRCPRCRNESHEGHKPGCTLAAALQKARGGS